MGDWKDNWATLNHSKTITMDAQIFGTPCILECYSYFPSHLNCNGIFLRLKKLGAPKIIMTTITIVLEASKKMGWNAKPLWTLILFWINPLTATKRTAWHDAAQMLACKGLRKTWMSYASLSLWGENWFKTNEYINITQYCQI